MHQWLLTYLSCPSCHAEPQLIAFQEQAFDQAEAQPIRSTVKQEVSSGVLQCTCGAVWPIIDGVPRFVTGAIEAFPAFSHKHREELEKLSAFTESSDALLEKHPSDDYDDIRKSFSQEWGLFDYTKDKTWGWTLDQRKAVFLEDMNLHSSDLSGKTLLDAGCGNGTLTAALTALGLEVVGLDLNEDLGRAYANRAKFAKCALEHVNYIQGNIVAPPLKEEMFDLVYSSGVIHHTPNSQAAFASLVSMTRPGGRLYVWVYGKRAWPIRAFFWLGRGSKRWLSHRSLLAFCRFIAPAYRAGATALNALGIMAFRPRSVREITLDLFDAFAPRYNHYHTTTEVQSWFQAANFVNIQVSGIQKHGFGMYGDKT